MKIYFCLLFMVVLLSCEFRNDRVKRKYILENGTNREIKIDFYDNSIFKGSSTKKGTGVIREGLADDGGMGKSLSPTFNVVSDSIVVTYDNKKRQIYYYNQGYNAKPQTNRNILKEDAYIVENNELYRFIFTEEDYDNAEDL